MTGILAMIVYLGCYTDAANTNGLHCLELDAATGAMKVVASYPVQAATYQALSSDGATLYSCVRGGLASFAASGAALSEKGRVDLGGTPCHVSLSADGRSVFWADYGKARAGSVEVRDGAFGNGASYRHSGDGPNKPRQAKAHCHQAIPTPDGAGFCVVDLGMDAIVTYPKGDVFATKPAGAGPRHALFHPNGRLAFVLFELGNKLGSYAWDPARGFSPLDMAETLPPGDTGRGYDGDLAAAIRLSPDMKRVIVSNRGENSLVSYDYDEATGRLSQKARSPLPGSWPRDFIFVDDTLALVALERSGKVVSLRYNPVAGSFGVVGELGGFFRPVALTRAK